MQDGNLQELLGQIYLRLSIAAARKRVFALRADKEKYGDLALFFIAMAESEEIQAQRILYMLRGTVAYSAENGREVLEEELPMLKNLYQQMRESADRYGVGSISHLSGQEIRVNTKNSSLMKKAQIGYKVAGFYQICSFCGYTHEGEPPEECPICKAPKKRFRRIDGRRTGNSI